MPTTTILTPPPDGSLTIYGLTRNDFRRDWLYLNAGCTEPLPLPYTIREPLTVYSPCVVPGSTILAKVGA